jgi:DNA-binding NarL/FixJ family response regulator
MIYNIAMADDHVLLRQGLAGIITSFGNYHIQLQASNGKDLIEQLKTIRPLPDLILLDISMPIMDGFETSAYLQLHYPSIKVLALSMMDNEDAIIRMIRNGARGYVLKDANPEELKAALHDVITKGYYYSDLISGRLIFSINKAGLKENLPVSNDLNLTEKELELLRYACTEMTYKEIADLMHISPRTVDGYRDELFKKLGVKSRVGLALFAIKQGIVKA